MLAEKQLPQILKQVLSNPKIIKVGRCVTSDLKYLQQACQSSTPFVGRVDLGRLAKDRLLVKSAHISLADLCAVVLHKRLNKNVVEQISTSWKNEELTQGQINYGALDSYAGLEIYNKLCNTSLPSALPNNPDISTPVLLFNSDRTRVLASGMISPHVQDDTFMGIHLSLSRSVIEVHRVFIPGALIANGTSNRRLLDEFGPPPFHIPCLRNHLRQPTTEQDDVIFANGTGKAANQCSETMTTSNIQAEHTSISKSGSANLDPSDIFPDPYISTPAKSLLPDSSPQVGNLLLDVTYSHCAPSWNPEVVKNYTPDPVSQAEGERVLKEAQEKKWCKYV